MSARYDGDHGTRSARRAGTRWTADPPRWRIVVLTAFIFCCPLLAAPVVTYPIVAPGYRVELPRDEGSHPAFRTEWWYVTGQVRDEQGAEFGFQVTFFRSRPGTDESNPSRFAAKQLLFAHVAVSDPKRGHLLRDERSARAGFDMAAAKEGVLDVAIDDWSLRTTSVDGYRSQIHSKEFQLALEYKTTQPPLIHGVSGYSQKGPQTESASYYFTLPQLQTSGTMVIGGHVHQVAGVAWLDHEWSSAILDTQAQGWDWVGINLDDGGALMAFQMRDAAGREHWAAATHRAQGASATNSFTPDQVEWTPQRRWRSGRTGIDYPVEWRIRLGERTVVLRPLFDDQENDARGSTGTVYWEGAVIASDEAGRRIGRGYLELTGYGGKVRL